MAKLSARQRKNLPDDQFGLPNEKGYPMPDEAHVRSAIAYFHSCPQNKRKELASNINRIAKSYGMKIKLKPHSPFKPYADKEIVEESGELITEYFIDSKDRKAIIKEYFPYDVNRDNLNFDQYHRAMQNQNIYPGKSTIKPINDKLNETIDSAIRSSAQKYLDKYYMTVFNKNQSVIADYIYDSDLKICYDITRNFFYAKSVDDPEFVKKIKGVKNKDLLKNAFREIEKEINVPVVRKVVDDITKAIDGVHPTFKWKDDKKGEEFFDTWAYLDYGLERELMNPENWDKVGGPVLVNDLGLIGKVHDIRNFSEEEINQFVTNNKIINDLCMSVLSKLVNDFNFPPLKDGVWFDSEVIELSRRGIIDGYFISGDTNEMSDSLFRIAIKMNKCIYIPIHCWHDKEKCIVNAVKMFDNDVHPQYFTTICDKFIRSKYQKVPKIPIRTITFKCTNASFDSAMEGLHFSKNGDIRIYLSSHKSYMDKYAAIHNALVEDYKAQNLPAMKHDLAYLFALIASIETQLHAPSRGLEEGTPEYADAIKARMFAKNDFKSYMKIVQKQDPSFKFMKFYEENNYDKEVYTIYTDDVIGIKNFFRKLLL